MEDYKKINVQEYVQEGLKNGTMISREAVKFSRIIARQGTLGETVTSWSVDSKGKEIREREGVVKEDETTREPGWIATKVDSNGEIIIDANGHANEWIIDDSKFRSKYEVDPENVGLFKPKGGPQMFVRIPENVALEQWGSEMFIAAGGYINVTNPNDMYGISERDFTDTYIFTDEMDKSGPKL